VLSAEYFSSALSTQHSALILRFDIFTLFPGMFQGPFAESIIHNAIDEQLLSIHIHNIRDYTTDKHHVTDDYAYGGGGGMVMKPDPIFTAVESVLGLTKSQDSIMQNTDSAVQDLALNTQLPLLSTPIILMSPAGRRFNHEMAKELARHERIALICGHYEGVDERVREQLCTDAISIGDYVLTGGELPAMVIVDAVARQIPKVLPEFAPLNESHANGLLEYPHYTRPPEFRGWRVPDILLSGHHANIKKWRQQQSELRTRAASSQRSILEG
jgi:tRNA (guanine37-N1)-methyltransferase